MALLFLLLHLVSVSAHRAEGVHYFVSALHGASACPVDIKCYSLSYFTEHPSLYFSDNTVFYFLEGRHVLNDTIEINGVSNLTLKGLGTMEQGFHYTVLQSTVEISCEGAVSAGLVFINVSDVSISDLLITRCNGPPLKEIDKEFYEHLLAIGTVILEAENQSSSISIIQSANFLMSGVSIVNTTGYGLTAINLFNSMIVGSSFASNNREYPCLMHMIKGSSQHFECTSGNALISFTYNWPDECLNFKHAIHLEIKHSNFSFGYSKLDSKNVSTAFGGGLTVLLDQGGSYCTDISIVDVTAFKNTARLSGNINFFATQHTTCFSFHCDYLKSLYGNSNFVSSHGYLSTSGGGLQISFGTVSSLVLLNCSGGYTGTANVSIQRSEFSSNFGEFGGGANVWIYDVQIPVILYMQACMFSYNKGSRGVGLYINHNERPTSFKVSLVNTSVTESIYNGQSSILQDFSSSVTFFYISSVDIHNILVSSSSSCYGIYAYYSVLTFHGENNAFINNTSLGNGGAIYLSLSSNIKLTQNSFITFANNFALGMGGAVFVDTNHILVTFCFLDVPEYSDSLGMRFINNSAAIQGDAIFIDSCSRLQRDQLIRGKRFLKIMNFSQQQEPVGGTVSSFPYQIYHCSNNETIVKRVEAYPGESVILQIVTRGIFSGLSQGLIEMNENKDSELTASYIDTRTLTISKNCTNIFHVIKAGEKMLFFSPQQKQYDHFGLVSTNRRSFNISILDCPVGFELLEDVCHCSAKLDKLVSNLTCNITTKTIIRVGNKWIGLLDNNSNTLLVTTDCPYDYCVDGSVSFNELTPDNQCRMNRSGIMCGQCSEGLSLMLGSNQCGVCTNSSLYLLVVFGVAGIVLVLFLVVLNLTVSVGTINGLIFYTNVIKINEHAFLSNSSLPVLSQFISWFNLDLGINTCFISNLGAIAKLALQFVFPAYIWILIGIVIIICKYSQRLSYYIGHNAVPVFATLILLSYTKILRTLVPILKFERLTVLLENSSMYTWHFWAADGNIEPSSPYYISLASLGVSAVIFFTAPYTILLLFHQLILAKCKRPSFQQFCLSFKPLFDAYFGPYKIRFRVWPGLLLCVRAALVIVAVFANDEVYLSVATSFGIILLGSMGYLNGVYDNSIFANALEYWSILNITILSAVVEVVPYAAVIDTSIMLCTFLVVILYHSCTIKKLIKYRSQLLGVTESFFEEESIDSDSVALSRKDIDTTDIRESLLFSWKRK